MLKIIILIYLGITLIDLILDKMLGVLLAKHPTTKEIFLMKYPEDEEDVNKFIESMKTPIFTECLEYFIPIYNVWLLFILCAGLIFLKFKSKKVMEDVKKMFEDDKTW